MYIFQSAKEKTKVEGDILVGVFTSSSMKGNKKKTDREKTTVSKRNSDPIDSSIDCPERRGSWANVFNRYDVILIYQSSVREIMH